MAGWTNWRTGGSSDDDDAGEKTWQRREAANNIQSRESEQTREGWRGGGIISQSSQVEKGRKWRPFVCQGSAIG